MRTRTAVLVCICVSVVFCALSDAQAWPRLTFRRAVGLVSIGGSVFFGLEARDWKEEADDLYDDYERATTSAAAEELYDEVTENDLKSGANLVLSACLAVNGLRLLFSSGEPELRDLYGQASPAGRNGLSVRLEGHPQRRQITLALLRPM